MAITIRYQSDGDVQMEMAIVVTCSLLTVDYIITEEVVTCKLLEISQFCALSSGFQITISLHAMSDNNVFRSLQV